MANITYPSTSSVALTITLASLASDTNLLAGRAGTAVDNRTNLDLDHLLSGQITTGTSPTVDKTIEIWVAAPISIASGTPTYPDSITGTDAAKTMTSNYVKQIALRRAAAISVDATSNRAYPIAPVSIAALFDDNMPPFWLAFVVHNTGVALHATSGNHFLHYFRVQ